MWFHKTKNSSYNFKAPSITADSDKKIEVVFPTSEAQTPAYAATQAVTIDRQVTCIDLGTLTGACTLNATITSNVERGARVTVKALSDGTARTVTFGTGFTSPTMAGTISKTKVMTFIYDGTTFLPNGVAVQLD